MNTSLLGRKCKVDAQADLPKDFEGEEATVVATWVSGAGLLYVAVEFEFAGVVVPAAINSVKFTDKLPATKKGNK